MTAPEFFCSVEILYSSIYNNHRIRVSYITLLQRKIIQMYLPGGLLYYSEKNFLMMNDAQLIFLSEETLEEKSILMKA